GLRRVLFLLIAFPVFCKLQLLHWLCFIFDAIFFPGYRKVRIERPLFISGIPRSGTTFVHRSLAHDERFTSFTTWEAILAPSIIQRKLIRALARLDRALGAPVTQFIQVATRKLAGDFNNIHKVGLDAAEEDYLSLLPIGGCFILLLAFPFATELRQLANFDQAPAARRERLLRAYQRLIQKHLYCAAPGSVFLSKNAAFASWVPALQSQFADARFILCVREPASALSSQLSSIQSAGSLFGTDPASAQSAQTFAELFAHNYTLLTEVCCHARPEKLALIDQGDLKQDSAAMLRACLAQLQIEPTQSMEAAFDQIPTQNQASHLHKSADFPLDKAQIEVCIRPSYEQLLATDTRVLVDPNTGTPLT
ncbi:MAG: sulfotransferase, partial [Verrucomicrobiota bacterium]